LGRRTSTSNQNIPALATLFDGAATAQGGDAGHQAALVAAAAALLLGRRLFVLHGRLALRRTVLALGRPILTLRGPVLTLGRTVALEKREERVSLAMGGGKKLLDVWTGLQDATPIAELPWGVSRSEGALGIE
jgi:hypothetical protein